MKNENYPLYDVPQLNNLKELVNYCAEIYGNKPAFVYEQGGAEVTISYRRFKTDVDALGTAFFDMGIKSMKVALIGENSYEWLLTYFATVNSGNVIVPLDKELPADDIGNILKMSDAMTLIHSDSYSDIACQIKEKQNNIRHYINMDSLLCLTEQGNNAIIQGDRSVVDCTIDNNTLTALIFTSGTTGMAKGIMLTHKSLMCNTIGVCQNAYWSDRNLLVLPLHHNAGLVGVLCMIVHGSSIAISGGLKNLQNDFQKYKPRNTVLVPLFIETFFKQIEATAGEINNNVKLREAADKIFGGSLETIITTGAPLNKKFVEGYRGFGVNILNVYGQTEYSAAISINRNNYCRYGSVGQIIPCCELKLSNQTDDGHGEILVKGNSMMLGYYKNELATQEAIGSGWLITGDIGYIDDDGFLYISGRKKNLIIMSNGKNVYPEELEFALSNMMPYIKEVVVYADGDQIVAEVFLDIENYPDSASRLKNDILIFNKTQPNFKNISRTIIRATEFPKTTTKKIKRRY